MEYYEDCICLRCYLSQKAEKRIFEIVCGVCFALLTKNDLTIPKTHAGLIAKLWQNRKELSLDEDTIKNISRIQSLRESSDYGVIPTVTEDDLKLVEKVIERLMEVLRC